MAPTAGAAGAWGRHAGRRERPVLRLVSTCFLLRVAGRARVHALRLCHCHRGPVAQTLFLCLPARRFSSLRFVWPRSSPWLLDCKWLNTCVGGSNYHLFFASMTFALLLLAYQLAISLFLFVSTFRDDYLGESAAAYIRGAYGSFSGVLLQVLLGVLVVISAPLVLSLLQLFLLHVYLWQRKITTYEVRVPAPVPVLRCPARNSGRARALLHGGGASRVFCFVRVMFCPRSVQWIMERRHALQVKEEEAKARAEAKQMQSGITMVAIRSSNGQPTPGGPAAAAPQQHMQLQQNQQSQLQPQQPSQQGAEFRPPYVDSVRASGGGQGRWAHEHTPALDQHTPGGPDEAADQLATHSFARAGSGGGGGLGMFPGAGAGAATNPNSNAPERVSSHLSSAAGGLMHQRTITVGDVAMGGTGRSNLGVASRPISASRSQLQAHDRDRDRDDPSRSYSPSPVATPATQMRAHMDYGQAAAAASGGLALHNAPGQGQGLAYGNNMDVSSVSGRHRATAAAASHRRPSAHMLPLSSAMAVGAAVSAHAAPPANAVTTIHVGRSSWSRTRGSPALAPLDNASGSGSGSGSGFGITSPSGVSQPLPPALTVMPGLSRPGSVQLAPIPMPPGGKVQAVSVRVDTSGDTDAHAASMTPPRPARHAHSHSIPGAIDSPSPVNALSGIRSPSGMEVEAGTADAAAGGMGGGAARDASAAFALRSSSGQSSLAPLPASSQQQPLTPTAHRTHFGPPSGVSALALRPLSAASLEAEADAFLADPRATEAKFYHAPHE